MQTTKTCRQRKKIAIGINYIRADNLKSSNVSL